MLRPATVPSTLAFVVALGLSSAANADFLRVPDDYPTIQAAIDAAPNGAVITVAAGEYVGDIDFHGKLLTVEGSGPDSVIRGTGKGPVVRFTSGEGELSILDSFTITGGLAASGGGILIQGSSPTILRNVIVGNSATSVGSGMYIGGSLAAPLVANNLMIFNTGRFGGDPHTVQVSSSSPRLVNNTIVLNDSNAILTSGEGSPEIRNNILARNGTRFAGGGVKGRGICDFAAGTLTRYNLFFRNARAALLIGSTDYKRIRQAQKTLGLERLSDNIDAAPRYSAGRLPRSIEAATPDRFVPSADPNRPSRALHAGDPDPAWRNHDGTRNTMGFTGGPLAPVM